MHHLFRGGEVQHAQVSGLLVRSDSPPNPPRVAAQEAAQSSRTAGSMVSTARAGPIVPPAPRSSLGVGPAVE